MLTQEIKDELFDRLRDYGMKDLIWTIIRFVEDRAKETSVEESMRHFGFGYVIGDHAEDCDCEDCDAS